MCAMKWAVGMVVVAGLFGCASTRPPLPEAMYRSSAGYLTAIERCSKDGFMDPATAAQGFIQEREALHTYTFDVERLQREGESMSHLRGLSQDQCTARAIQILAKAKEREGNIAYANQVREEQARMIQATRTRTTVCNHLGNQSLCGTY